MWSQVSQYHPHLTSHLITLLSPSDAEVIQRIKSAVTTRVTIVPADLAVPRPKEEYEEKYQNIGVVGSGAFGSVYVAR